MNDWKKDPRLKKMDPEKIQVLSDFSRRLEQTPKPQMLSALLSFQMEAEEKGIRFSDGETELLVSILSSRMPPSEQKKLSMLKLFARKMGSGRS